MTHNKLCNIHSIIKYYLIIKSLKSNNNNNNIVKDFCLIFRFEYEIKVRIFK